MTGDWLTKPTLTGDRVLLRPLRHGDAEAMARVLDDPELLRLTGSVDSTAQAAAGFTPDEAFAQWYATREEADGRLDLAVVDRACDRVVGEVVLNEWDPAANECNLRILLGAEGRDRGLGTEAVRLVTAYAFEELGLQRVTLSVLAFNPRGRAVYAKVGYRYVGTITDDLVFDGEAVDSHVMAVTAGEWRARHGAAGAHPREGTG